MVEDLLSRSLNDTPGFDRDLARDQLPNAVRDFIDRAVRTGASGVRAQEAIAFGRDALVQLQERLVEERAAAESELETLKQSRDILEDMRDELAKQTLDGRAIASLASSLPAAFSERTEIVNLTRELITLQQTQFDQNLAITAALEALTPGDLGLGARGVNDNQAASPAPAPPAAPADQAAIVNSSIAVVRALGGEQFNQDVLDGLAAIEKRLDEQMTQSESQQEQNADRDNKRNSYLKQLSDVKRAAG